MAVKKKKEKVNPDLPHMEGPGVAPVRIPELDDAAMDYRRIRDRRQELTPKEVAAKEKLSALMHAHEETIGKGPDGSLRYVYDGWEVIVEPAGETLKVRAYKDPGDPGSE